MSKNNVIESAVISEMLEKTQASIEDGSSMDSSPILELISQNQVNSKVIRIAGPCALQNAEQGRGIAELLKGTSGVMRAPHHKPRTRPFSPAGERLYTGIGAEAALPIYKEIQEAGMPIITEVMEPSDVAILKEAISAVWTGSRTMVGDLIEKIGAAALEAGKPIMVKNPMIDDMSAYIGMIEAAIAGSNGEVPVMACIRGLCPIGDEEKETWRNTPNLDYVTALREAFPNLPIIVDPSHMVSKKDPNSIETVAQILKEAMERGASGHMVEVAHPDHKSVTDPGIPVHAYLDMIASNSTL